MVAGETEANNLFYQIVRSNARVAWQIGKRIASVCGELMARHGKHPVIRHNSIWIFLFGRGQGSDHDQVANSFCPPNELLVRSRVRMVLAMTMHESTAENVYDDPNTCLPPSPSAVGFLLRIAFPFTKIICNPFYGSLNVESWRQIHRKNKNKNKK